MAVILVKLMAMPLFGIDVVSCQAMEAFNYI